MNLLLCVFDYSGLLFYILYALHTRSNFSLSVLFFSLMICVVGLHASFRIHIFEKVKNLTFMEGEKVDEGESQVKLVRLVDVAQSVKKIEKDAAPTVILTRTFKE
jgi:hypothetical protein